MPHNVSAMVNTDIQRTELSGLHLAKFLIFSLFSRHVKLNILRALFKAPHFGLSTKTRIKYSHCGCSSRGGQVHKLTKIG